ncbi:similar to Saccharomyces cerevisiae YNL250W RAD50 Subunit of MRX complex [Maudiozyma barnettii]|uniref:DNA repair protein RAD50 n=1 Tax=Maudiozyma barnettii TaxID=61262 RepID=A0A8H2VE13_9SACH|nr:MRX complex DNA-binding subunit [Kazachstania barnettii]CAB4253830.1 similar to Saccharomyces cerevisiae YNL250W RAD50 Subunit of MRX complex [Kazachstania barnettii]CAD1781579.1 similar to Saccharomyces cerevisiae YNL250W RAD50 Subunit of MRX complex [Kazachstania barnettii]
MSSVYKLSIQGIRSFDSNDRETIEFGTPLTLIVGMNGSGKTTIIECLKYATTGDLPPNSKGGVFIHDPKITGEKDIRAQVKLAFTSANGLNMIVTRNIQLLVKRNTNTFKTLEGQLVAINKMGERTTLSTRSVELDAQVPLYMGVPKAILEYVIFCHQEDSLWPLSEPSNLKKKFDEIFQAMKFTKALDNLKTIKKDMAVDIKLLKQSVEHMKLDRDRSKATKINVYRLEAKIGEYQEEVNEIEKQLNILTEKSDKLFKSNQDFQEVLSKVDNLKTLKSITENDINRIKQSVEIIDLPTSEIENLLENFSNTIAEKEMEIKGIEETIQTAKNSAARLQSSCNELLARQGVLKAKEDSYHKNLDDIKILKKDVANIYQLNDEETNLDHFMTNLKQQKTNLTTDLKEFSQKTNKEIDHLETRLNDITYKSTVLQQKIDYNVSDKTKLESKILSLSKEVPTIRYSSEDLLNEKDSLDKLNADLILMEKEDVIETITSQIKEKNDRIIALEKEFEIIQNKLTKTSEQSEIFAKLGLAKESLKEKQSIYQSIIEKLKIDENFKNWGLVINDDLDLDFKKFFIELQKKVAISNKDFHEKDKAFNESKYQRNNFQEEIVRNNQSITKITLQIEESLPENCSIEDYDEIIEESELSYKTSLENLKMHQTTLEFNRKALDVAREKDCCYLCSRKFETSEFKSKVLSELKQRTDAKFEVTLKEIVQEEKLTLEELRSLEKYVVQLKSLKQANSIASDKLSEIEQKVIELEEGKRKAEEEGTKLKNDKEHAESVLRPLVERFINLKQEISRLGKESDLLTNKLEAYKNSDGSVQSVSELQAEQRSSNNEMRQLRSEIANLQDSREIRNKKHSKLVDNIREKTSIIDDIERTLSNANTLAAEIEKNKEVLVNLERDIIRLKGEWQKFQEQKLKEKDSLAETKNIISKDLDFKRSHLSKFETDINRFSELLNAILDYEKSGVNALPECVQQYNDINAELMTIKTDIDGTYDMLNIKKQKIKDSSNEQRNMRDNIELLKMVAKLEVINSQIGELDVQNAESERETYQRESSRLRNEYEKLTSENAGKLGEIKQLQNQIESLKRQLRSDYKDIDDKYRKEWVELQTRTFVTDDIDTYSKTLDNAIMRYHGLKMEDINRIIDELWKRTYSGTDIDTIKIRSDEVTNTTRGKSYNYRVVMYKQDAELDMRGRCSAGQKVLASIIIRLALSETFGINCGVIALDEPTTNLDEENIESLAKSLSNIIQFRRHQKNFQLIVITHDEKFLNHMNASDFTDHFFKVKRDDRQKSQIEWVDINKVTEY